MSNSSYEAFRPSSVDELRTVLTLAKLPLERWGVGHAKTVEKLFIEIKQGDSELAVDSQHGELLRRVNVLWVDVFHGLGQSALKLVESKQVFKNGSERIRELPASLGEKMKPNETVTDATIRAVAEELGILNLTDIQEVPAHNKTTLQPHQCSYLGLTTDYRDFYSETIIHPDEFKPEGYKEVQTDKVSYFEWKVFSDS